MCLFCHKSGYAVSIRTVATARVKIFLVNGHNGDRAIDRALDPWRDDRMGSVIEPSSARASRTYDEPLSRRARGTVFARDGAGALQCEAK